MYGISYSILEHSSAPDLPRLLFLLPVFPGFSPPPNDHRPCPQPTPEASPPKPRSSDPPHLPAIGDAAPTLAPLLPRDVDLLPTRPVPLPTPPAAPWARTPPRTPTCGWHNTPAVRQLGEILLPFPMRANRVSVPEVAPSSRHHDAASTAMSCASGWDAAADADLWTARLRLPPPPRLQVRCSPGDSLTRRDERADFD